MCRSLLFARATPHTKGNNNNKKRHRAQRSNERFILLLLLIVIYSVMRYGLIMMMMMIGAGNGIASPSGVMMSAFVSFFLLQPVGFWIGSILTELADGEEERRGYLTIK